MKLSKNCSNAVCWSFAWPHHFHSHWQRDLLAAQQGLFMYFTNFTCCIASGLWIFRYSWIGYVLVLSPWIFLGLYLNIKPMNYFLLNICLHHSKKKKWALASLWSTKVPSLAKSRAESNCPEVPWQPAPEYRMSHSEVTLESAWNTFDQDFDNSNLLDKSASRGSTSSIDLEVTLQRVRSNIVQPQAHRSK